MRDPGMQKIVDYAVVGLVGSILIVLFLISTKMAFGGAMYGPDAPDDPVYYYDPDDLCWLDRSHFIPGWDVLEKLGATDASNVTIVFTHLNHLGNTCDTLPAGQGLQLSEAGGAGEYLAYVNPGEDGPGEPDGVDNDSSGCIDDQTLCEFDTTGTDCPSTPNGNPIVVPEMNDHFHGAEPPTLKILGGTRLSGGASYDASNCGMALYPGLTYASLNFDDSLGDHDPDAVETLLDAWRAENPSQKFILFVDSYPGLSTRTPLNKLDCDTVRATLTAAQQTAFSTIESISNVLLTGYTQNDQQFPGCETDTKWLQLDQLQTKGSNIEISPATQIYSENGDLFPAACTRGPEGEYSISPSINDPMAYPEPACTEIPPYLTRDGDVSPYDYYEQERLVGLGLGYYGAYSYNQHATLAYAVPMMAQVVTGFPTPQELRNNLLTCAPRHGTQPGPDGLGGWSRGWGYGMPNVACAVYETSKDHGGDLDGDGVLDGAPGNDNCPYVPNPDQADTSAPAGLGDACNPNEGIEKSRGMGLTGGSL